MPLGVTTLRKKPCPHQVMSFKATVIQLGKTLSAVVPNTNTSPASVHSPAHHPDTHCAIHPPICPSIHLSTSMHASIPLSMYLSIHTCVCVCVCVCVLVAQPCPTLCNPMDCSPPGFSVQGILQVRILEWVALSFSGRSAQPRDQTQGLNPGLPHGMWILYSLSHQGSPVSTYKHTSISTPIPPWQNKRELSRHKYPVRNHRDFGGGSHRMGAELFSASWLGLH